MEWLHSTDQIRNGLYAEASRAATPVHFKHRGSKCWIRRESN